MPVILVWALITAGTSYSQPTVSFFADKESCELVSATIKEFNRYYTPSMKCVPVKVPANRLT